MTAFINPVPGFRCLAEVFEAGAAKKDGIRIGPDLCRHMASALSEGAEHVAVLVEFARSHGLVQSIEVAEAPALTPVQRQQLARHAVALDPGARVIAFPPAVRQVSVSEGGSAA